MILHNIFFMAIEIAILIFSIYEDAAGHEDAIGIFVIINFLAVFVMLILMAIIQVGTNFLVLPTNMVA